MNPDVKQKWLAALRSGEYTQTKGTLQRVEAYENISEPEYSTPAGYCCLGVLCEVGVADGVVEKTRRVSDGFTSPFMKYRYNDGDYLHLGAWQDALWDDSLAQWSGLKYDDAANLAELNDAGTSFAEIADVIEAEY